MVLLINNDVSGRLLSVEETLDSLEDAFIQLGEGNATFRQMSNLWFESDDPTETYRFGDQLGAILEPPRLALRIKSDLRKQLEEREIRYNGERGENMRFVLLFDGENGELLSIMNDRELQRLRVGATAGLACDYLSKENASTVGIIGSGSLARAHLQSYAVVRDLETAKVYSPTVENRERYAEEMSSSLGIAVDAVSNPETAVSGADIVSTCTNSEKPVYEAEWMKPGQFVSNVEAKGIPDSVRRSADTVITSTNDPYGGDFVGDTDDTIGTTALTETKYETLAEVLTGSQVGRENDHQTIFFENRAVSIQFPAVCNVIYEKAVDADLGIKLPLDWFQQSVA